jgi:hypothetical protein
MYIIQLQQVKENVLKATSCSSAKATFWDPLTHPRALRRTAVTCTLEPHQHSPAEAADREAFSFALGVELMLEEIAA